MRRALRGFFPVLLTGTRSIGAWGGKGTGIQRLSRLGLSIPRTGALPSFEVSEWIRALPGHTSALAAWRRWQSPEQESPAALERFRQTILLAPAPMDWEAGCLEFLKRLEGRPLIVRSSMTVEDDLGCSFAGAFDSVRVDSPTAKSLWRAVARVLASGYTREAAIRVLASDTRLADFTPSAIIQEWIEPKISGVCFSRDPLKPWGSKGIVEWTDQACASVVQGEGESITHVQADETAHASLAPFWAELWEAAARAEHALEAPADLEWVWDGRRLWFVQLRPVATEEARLLASCVRKGVRWSRELAEERFPEPMTSLGWTAIEDTLAPNLVALSNHFGVVPSSTEGMATSVRGWIYSDSGFFKFPSRVRIRFGGYLTSGRGHVTAVFKALCRFALSRYREEPLALPVLKTDLTLALLEPQAREILRSWQQHVRRHLTRISDFSSIVLKRGGTPTRASVLARMEELRTISLSFLEPDLAIFLVKDSLRKALQSLWESSGGKPAEFADLVAGFDGNRTLSMGQDWQDLIQVLKRDPGRAEFLKTLAAGALDSPSHLGEPARRAWKAFLQKNGHCRTSWDIALPGWGEEPAKLAPVLAASLLAEGRSAGQSPVNRRRQARELLFSRAPKRLEGALQLLEDFMRIDEELHFLSGLLLDPSRVLVLKAGGLLCKDGDLEKPTDVFHLKLSELKGHLRESGTTLRFLARRRRSEWERSRNLALPLEIPPLPRAEEPETRQGPAPTWSGVPVSPGVAIGRLHAASHLEDAKDLPAGAVLLTTSPNPALVPLYPALGGMICATGGILSHGFVAARELGLPAVSGLKAILETGDLHGRWVRLDGGTGSVELLPENSSAGGPMTLTGVNHLLLDLDGTLLASSGGGLRFDFLKNSIRYLRRRGVSSWRALKAIHGMRKAIERPGTDLTNEQRACQAFARALKIDETEARSLMHGMVGEVFPTLREHFTVIPGAREFVEWAGERYALTLATNPVWPREIVELRLSWAGIDPSCFGYITHAGVMRACKPCVEYYHELLDRLELEPSSALMVGDSRRKDLPAEKAGIKVYLLSQEGLAPLRGMLAEGRTT